MKIHHGPEFPVYFTWHRLARLILLWSGTKRTESRHQACRSDGSHIEAGRRRYQCIHALRTPKFISDAPHHSRWNSADYPRSEWDITDYLDAATGMPPAIPPHMLDEPPTIATDT